MRLIHFTIAPMAIFWLVQCEKPQPAVVREAVAEPPVATAPPLPEGALRYTLTKESTIKFIGSKVTSSNTGGFSEFTGHFAVKDGRLAGKDHRATIDMKSVWTDDPELTKLLKTADFFDVENHPTTTFEFTRLSKLVERTGEDLKPVKAADLTGNFTLRGVTKNITIPVGIREAEGGRLTIEARFGLDRKDFGIVYPGPADDLIRNQVIIELKMEAVPDPESPTGASK